MNSLDALKRKCSRCGSRDVELYTDMTSFQTVWDCYNCGYKEPFIPVPTDHIMVEDESAPTTYGDVERDLMEIEYAVSDLTRYATTQHELDQMERIRDIFDELISVIRRIK